MAQHSAEDRQAELAALIAGRSDEDIERGVEARGVTTVLDRVFRGMVEAFLPERAAGVNAVIQYNVTTAAATYTYALKVGDGKCELVKGQGGPARITLTLTLPNFLRLAAGSLNGMIAFATGKLRLQGDILLARRISGWFRQDG